MYTYVKNDVKISKEEQNSVNQVFRMSNNSSENEATQKTNILKEVYLQKRKLLTQESERLFEGKNDEYNSFCAEVDRKLEERKNFILRAAQTEEDLINATYRMTVKKLIEDYGQALVALKQSVLDKLDDERSQIEDEYLNDDIADDRKGTAFVSQKRKLRRRAAEDGSPTKEIAVDERPPMMVHQLSEESIMQDIMAIRRNMASSRLPKQAIQFQLPNLPSTARSSNHFDLNDLNLDDDDAVDEFLREKLNINFPENKLYNIRFHCCFMELQALVHEVANNACQNSCDLPEIVESYAIGSSLLGLGYCTEYVKPLIIGDSKRMVYPITCILTSPNVILYALGDNLTSLSILLMSINSFVAITFTNVSLNARRCLDRAVALYVLFTVVDATWCWISALTKSDHEISIMCDYLECVSEAYLSWHNKHNDLRFGFINANAQKVELFSILAFRLQPFIIRPDWQNHMVNNLLVPHGVQIQNSNKTQFFENGQKKFAKSVWLKLAKIKEENKHHRSSYRLSGCKQLPQFDPFITDESCSEQCSADDHCSAFVFNHKEENCQLFNLERRSTSLCKRVANQSWSLYEKQRNNNGRCMHFTVTRQSALENCGLGLALGDEIKLAFHDCRNYCISANWCQAFEYSNDSYCVGYQQKAEKMKNDACVRIHNPSTDLYEKICE
ncbi:hypothetical protein T03_7204 [Trichinella britovi]|uniref:Apple domain-containing protein n=1 Tax=Trichinella britovi TaxID=45882 RepID=A0A0V1CIG0_TRIBR|nr:hypothetical protein T03_7204 [Trichinella britovi]